MPGRTCTMSAVATPTVDSRDHVPSIRERETSGVYRRLKAATMRFGTSSLSAASVRSTPCRSTGAPLVHAAPMRLDVDRQPKRGICAIEQPVSRVERQAVERRLSSIIESGDADDAVVSAGGGNFEAEIPCRCVFE